MIYCELLRSYNTLIITVKASKLVVINSVGFFVFPILKIINETDNENCVSIRIYQI